MPTGYTHKIKDGQSFEDYAMGCARAFGALITMRDEPTDAEIPTFKSSSYHKSTLDKCIAELKMYSGMSISDAEGKALEEYTKAVEAYEKTLEERAGLSVMYADMLKKVEKWEPPTSAHSELKEFMADQIKKSRDSDCSVSYLRAPKLLSGEEWLTSNIEMSQKSLEYHKKGLKEEESRVDGRNEWVTDLRKSLT